MPAYILLIVTIVILWFRLRAALNTIDIVQSEYNSLYSDSVFWYNQALDLADYIEEITGIYVLEIKRE